jgi:phosphomannomutase
MQREIFLFDVDGTLTPAKQKAAPEFIEQFLDWLDNKEVYLVSGGSFPRLLDQLGYEVMEKISGVFPCMGNACYKNKIDEPGAWFKIYENFFEPPKMLMRALDKIVEESSYSTKTGRHYERRTGMVNFSVVGLNATVAQRKKYAKFDTEFREREKIVKKLRKAYSKIDFVIGGAVSIDIFPVGNDKSQILKKYFKPLPRNVIIHFIGDRIPFPGNDYALAKAVDRYKNGHIHEVESWEDTALLLRSMC